MESRSKHVFFSGHFSSNVMAAFASFILSGNTLHSNNNQPYLVRVTLNSKAHKPVALIFGSNWNLECCFLWGEESRRTPKKTLGARTRTNNKLDPHVTPGPGIEPGPQQWEVTALTTAPSPCIPKCISLTTAGVEMALDRTTICLD